MKKTLSPIGLKLETYDKLLKIIANYSHEHTKYISVREAVENMINEKYQQISGSMRW